MVDEHTLMRRPDGKPLVTLLSMETKRVESDQLAKHTEDFLASRHNKVILIPVGASVLNDQGRTFNQVSDLKLRASRGNNLKTKSRGYDANSKSE